MPAATLNIKIEQGADFSRLITFKNASGVPQTQAGYTFRGQLRTATGQPLIVASFNFTLRNQTTNTGEVEWTMPALVTASIPLEPQETPDRQSIDFAYDVERVSSTGVVERIFQGLATVSPEVTL